MSLKQPVPIFSQTGSYRLLHPHEKFYMESFDTDTGKKVIIPRVEIVKRIHPNLRKYYIEKETILAICNIEDEEIILPFSGNEFIKELILRTKGISPKFTLYRRKKIKDKLIKKHLCHMTFPETRCFTFPD